MSKGNERGRERGGNYVQIDNSLLEKRKGTEKERGRETGRKIKKTSGIQFVCDRQMGD